MEICRMSWNVLENLQNVLEKSLVSWNFLIMVKGAQKCLEFTSGHLETQKLPGPLAGPEPPALWIMSQLSSIYNNDSSQPFILCCSLSWLKGTLT